MFCIGVRSCEYSIFSGISTIRADGNSSLNGVSIYTESPTGLFIATLDGENSLLFDIWCSAGDACYVTCQVDGCNGLRFHCNQTTGSICGFSIDSKAPTSYPSVPTYNPTNNPTYTPSLTPSSQPIETTQNTEYTTTGTKTTTVFTSQSDTESDQANNNNDIDDDNDNRILSKTNVSVLIVCVCVVIVTLLIASAMCFYAKMKN